MQCPRWRYICPGRKHVSRDVSVNERTNKDLLFSWLNPGGQAGAIGAENEMSSAGVSSAPDKLYASLEASLVQKRSQPLVLLMR